MADAKLTKDADKLACVIYWDYISRREDGEEKAAAKHFAFGWERELLPNENPQDVIESYRELCRAFPGIKKYQHNSFTLGDDFIIYMENRFPKGAAQILEHAKTALGIASSVIALFFK